MSSESPPPSPVDAVVPLPRATPEWQQVLHVSNQVVLYNPTSHALVIRPSSNLPEHTRQPCPYCKQALPADFESEDEVDVDIQDAPDPAYHSRASDYFRLLEISNETSSRPASPLPRESEKSFPAEKMAEGYFKAFFQEEYKLGMGANGSVFLCQHVLDGNPLGHFAVKKIAVGESHSYLLQILREVRLLERLHHPNIITYHHAWLESCRFSSFGPKVPTLHVLMQWAEGGSLDDFINIRLGRKAQHVHIDPLATFSLTPPASSRVDPSIPATASEEIPVTADPLSRSARIRAFRAFQHASPEERTRLRSQMEGLRRGQNGNWTAVHLLSAEEVKSLFQDVVQGLAFLHGKSILHLDLKPGNVLLTWDEGKLIPRAMLSDFGTSRDMLHGTRTRSGNTGTLEYTSPESLPSPLTGLLQSVDSKADMWSLGMILHKLIFFKLPYRYASAEDANGEPISTDREGDKLDRLENEVLNYPGFKSTPTLTTTFEARRLPRSYLMLLEGLLNVIPSGRPSVERVAAAISEGVLNPLSDAFLRTSQASSLVPVAHRRSDPPLPRALSPPPSSSSISATRPTAEMDDAGATKGGTGSNRRMSKSPPRSEKKRLEGPSSPPLLSADGASSAVVPGTVPHKGHNSTFYHRIPGRIWKTGFKSCILIAKVLSMTRLCAAEGGMFRTFVPPVVLSAAVLDTVVDGVWSSFTLGVFHLAIVFGCSRFNCC